MPGLFSTTFDTRMLRLTRCTNDQDDQMNTSRTSNGIIPALHPRCLLPRRYPRAAAPLNFLKKIERVEINSVEHFRGVTYYVVDVFLVHSTSRIPTNNLLKASSSSSATIVTSVGYSSKSKKNKRRQPRSSTSSNTATTTTTTEQTPSREPDFKIVRRFASFDQLRGQISSFCTREQIGLCNYCDHFRMFLFHCFTHPRAFVKLCANIAMRKKVLTQFLNRTIELAIGLESNSGRPPVSCALCVGYQVIPRLVDHFIRRDMSVIERTEMLHH